QRKENVSLLDHLKAVQDAGCGEILLNSVDRDGTMKGYDVELVRQASDVLDVPLIACGGAGKIEHFREVVDAGASAAAAGSFFVFHGKHRAVLITYPQRSELERLFGATE
ncbi:MAG: imidazole glycerol phosphate synthase subunit HisF, partial [Candidatus Zixiibacteriota bacterium]